MVTKLIFENGACSLVIDDQRVIPISYRSFTPQGNTVKNFSEKGIQLFSVFPTGIPTCVGGYYSPFGEIWLGEGEYNWENLDNQMNMFLDNAPEAKFSLMIHLDTREWFTQKYPECNNSFFYLIQTAGYETWRRAASRFVCDLLDYIEDKYPNRLFSVFLIAGTTCEWFTGKPPAELPPNELHKKAFQKYCGNTSAKIPSATELEQTNHGVFRDPVAQKSAIDYWRFHNEEVAETISYFSDIVKKHSDRKYLVGLFYGYLMGLGNDTLWRGHNCLKQILEDQNIDIIFAPAQYAWRGLESTSASYLPLDSIKLHSKCYWHEVDNTTHLCNDNPYAKILQCGSHRRMETQQQDTMYFRRETAVALTKGYGYWWFDMFGGWYDSPEMMEEIKNISQVAQKIWTKDVSSNSEVAVFADEESYYYLSPFGKLGNDLICRQVEQLTRAGFSWDAYLSNDICHENFRHEQYKLYIFLNQFKLSSKMFEMIKSLRQSGKSMLFLFAPGYIQTDGFSLSKMQELTGFSFHLADLMSCKEAVISVNSAKYSLGYSEAVSPVFTTDTGTAFGHYKDTTIRAASIQEDEHCFCAWSGVGPLPYQVLTYLAKKAGCFIYSENGDPIFINKSLIGIFAHNPGVRVINLPKKAKLHELYTNELYEVDDNKTAAIDFKTDEMKLFELLL